MPWAIVGHAGQGRQAARLTYLANERTVQGIAVAAQTEGHHEQPIDVGRDLGADCASRRARPSRIARARSGDGRVSSSVARAAASNRCCKRDQISVPAKRDGSRLHGLSSPPISIERVDHPQRVAIDSSCPRGPAAHGRLPVGRHTTAGRGQRRVRSGVVAAVCEYRTQAKMGGGVVSVQVNDLAQRRQRLLVPSLFEKQRCVQIM